MTDVRITLTEISVVEGDSLPVSITVFDGVFVNQGGGGGDGAVDSVNGETGDVVLTATDVSAQPVDSDLTAIAALTTTTYGRALLAMANAAALRTVAGLGTAAVADTTAFQPVDSDLTAIAALSTTSYGRAFLGLANQAGLMALLLSADTSTQGIVELATSAEALTGTDTSRAVTPAALQAKIDALVNSAPGLLDTLGEIAAQLATDETAVTALTTTVGLKLAKASNLSDVANAATALGNLGGAPTASPTLTGTVTIPTVAGTSDSSTKAASTAFVQAVAALLAPLASPVLTGNPTAPTPTAGDNDTSIATTAFVTNAVAKQPEVLIVAVSDEATAITTGTAVVTFRMPFAMTLTAVRASLTVASSSGLPTVNIKESGTTIFSTNLSIDATEKTSTTAATPAVISDSSLADDAEMTVDITVAGTGAKGLKVYLIGTRT